MKASIGIHRFLGLQLVLIGCLFYKTSHADDLQVGSYAPNFSAKLEDGTPFELQSRRGSWTVLFFYPKAGTPGCTKQACAFRDAIDKIRDQGAEVYGISGDTVEDQAEFHKKHQLKFHLIADPEAKVIELYGSKVPLFKMSKRWTFIIDDQLKIRSIDKDVDPASDASKIGKRLQELKIDKSQK